MPTLTRDEFVATFESIPPQNVTARRDLIYRATWEFNLLSPEQAAVWYGRTDSEARPQRQNVVIGYVQEDPTKDPSRPNDKSMAPPVHHPDGVQEYRRHASAPPPARRAAGKQEFQRIGDFVEWRPHE